MVNIFKKRVVTVIIVFVLFGLFPLVLFKYLAFPRASAELKQGVQRNLEGVVNKQRDMLTLLLDERKSHARNISDSIQSALFIYGAKDFVSLITGENGCEYLKLKTQMECIKADYGYKGIFVSDGAGIIHVTTEGERSMRGTNIMKENPFNNVQKTLYDGETCVSDITHFTLNSKTLDGKNEVSPSMFISYPIKNENHDVIGAVVLWMDSSVLNKAMKNIALGKTGEAYLVNKDGVMVTQSRFSEHLKRNDDMCRRCHTVVEPETILLTKGVKRCIMEKTSGCELQGYRDYDGLKVVGAWTWLKNLNMGLVVEIDADEALGAIGNINDMVRSLMAVIIIPAFILAILVYRKLITGNMIADMALPRKTVLAVTSIITLGLVIAILDGYEFRKERGYLREQKYKVHNPLDVFGSIVTQRDEDFIKSNVSKFKEESPTYKTENTIRKEYKKKADTMDDTKQPLDKAVVTWELKH